MTEIFNISKNWYNNYVRFSKNNNLFSVVFSLSLQ